MLHEVNSGLVTFFTHILWPDTRLDFANMGLAKKEHTKALLPDTASNGIW